MLNIRNWISNFALLTKIHYSNFNSLETKMFVKSLLLLSWWTLCLNDAAVDESFFYDGIFWAILKHRLLSLNNHRTIVICQLIKRSSCCSEVQFLLLFHPSNVDQSVSNILIRHWLSRRILYNQVMLTGFHSTLGSPIHGERDLIIPSYPADNHSFCMI